MQSLTRRLPPCSCRPASHITRSIAPATGDRRYRRFPRPQFFLSWCTPAVRSVFRCALFNLKWRTDERNERELDMTYFKSLATKTLLACLVAAVANTCLAGNRAQPSQLSDQQTYAASTHLYTYHYTLAN